MWRDGRKEDVGFADPGTMRRWERGFIRADSPLFVGAKVLTVIFVGEFFIMRAFDWLGVPPESPDAAWMDALALGLIAWVAIQLWVVRPLAAMSRREAMLATVAERLGEGLAICEPSKRGPVIVAVNPAFERITGWRERDVVGKTLAVLEGEPAKKTIPRWVRRALGAEGGLHVRRELVRKDGEHFLAEVAVFPVRGPDGAVDMWAVLLEDVSEEAAREEEIARYLQALDQAEEAVCVFSPDGAVEYANRAFLQVVRAKNPAEVLGKDALWLFSADDEAAPKITLAMLRGERWRGHFRAQRCDGSTYEAVGSLAPVRTNGQLSAFICIHRDATEELQLQRQLERQQKMEAIGALAAGIAHDFNNLLAGMLGAIYLVRMEIAREHPQLAQRLLDVEQQGYRAAGTIRQLLSFARGTESEVQVFQVQPFLKELARFARTGLPETIELHMDVRAQKAQLCADPALLQQTLLNLITNARHAIEARQDRTSGRISLRAHLMQVEPGSALAQMLAEHHPRPEESEWLHIEVEDDGVGMDEHTLQKAFDPFFTTKPEGVGTGLGLPMARSHVESMGGALYLESSPGVGTTAHIYLPVVEVEEEDFEVEGTGETKHARGKGETVLVADDDARVRDALVEVLTRAGYKVVAVQNGREAMEMVRRWGEKLDAAILDVVMPHADGVEVAIALREQRKDMPLIFLTGYEPRKAAQHVREHPLLAGVPVLSKPYRLPELLFLLRRALDTTTPPPPPPPQTRELARRSFRVCL